MVPIALPALIALLVFGDHHFTPMDKPVAPRTIELVARGIDAPPPISLAVKRPDGTVWRHTFGALKPDVPVDISVWHSGPGSYHFTLVVGDVTKTFWQTLARPVLTSRLEVIWDGTPWPEGVVYAHHDDASREGHLHLRYVFLTTVQEPHRGVGIRIDDKALGEGDLKWIVRNRSDVPVRGTDENGRFTVQVQRQYTIDDQIRWRAARFTYVCLWGQRTEPQRLEPGGSMPIVPSRHVRGHTGFEAGVHRIVFDYGLIPKHPSPRLDDPLPMVTTRTLYRREGWFRLGPEPEAPKP